MLNLQVSRIQPKGKASRHVYDLSSLEKRGFTPVCPTDVVIVGTITSFFFFFFLPSYTPKLDTIFVSATSLLPYRTSLRTLCIVHYKFIALFATVKRYLPVSGIFQHYY